MYIFIPPFAPLFLSFLKRFISILPVILVLLAVVPVLAQEPDSNDGEMAEIVVSATRYKEEISKVAANVTVINESDIESSTAQSIPDLLMEQAGIKVSDTMGNGRSFNVDLRGFGETASSNTLVLVDGRRVNSVDLSATDWSQIPLDRVERIEIVRGGRGSVLYGDNASGGVINIITKEGDDARVGVEVRAGSYSTQGAEASLSGRNERISYSLNASGYSSEGYRDNSDTNATDAGINLGYYISNDMKIGLSAGYHYDKTGTPGDIKESEFSAGADRTDTFTPDDYFEVTDYYIKFSPEKYFFADSFIRLDASYRKRDSKSFMSIAGTPWDWDTELATIMVSPQLFLKGRFAGIMNNVTIGMDYQKADEDVVSKFGVSPVSEYDLNKVNYGYFISNDIAPTSSLTVSLGYRSDKTDYEFAPSTPDKRSFDGEAYNFGINYMLSDDSSIYASYSRGFRYPLLDELFNFATIEPGLLPQQTDNYEVGMRLFVKERTLVKLNLFLLRTKDEIFYNPFGGPFGFGANENLDGKTNRQGVEISFNTNVSDRVRLKGSYTHMSAKIEGGVFDGSDIPDAPADKATLGITVPYRKATISLNGVYVGERPFISDFSNSYSDQDSYFVLNSRLKYRWRKLTAFLDINNITDAKYSEFGIISWTAEKAYYPSPERNFLFGVSVEI